MDIDEAGYHASRAWSHSKISAYASGGFPVMATINDPVPGTPSMRFGSLVDSLLTRTPEETARSWVIIDNDIDPSVKAVVESLAGMTDRPWDEIPDGMFAAAMEQCNYQPRWKYETRRAKLEDGALYYKALSRHMTPVSRKDWDDAVGCARAVARDPFLGKLFRNRDTKDVEYIYQAKFLREMKLPNGTEVNVRIMPDLLVVNHRERTVQPVDLKTSSAPAYDFKQNFLKYRYDIQASLYHDVLEDLLSSVPGYEGYTLLPFLFAVVSRSDMVPVTWRYDSTDPSQAEGLRYGPDGKYRYKGWDQLLQEMVWYDTHNAVVPMDVKVGEPNDMLDSLNNSRR